MGTPPTQGKGGQLQGGKTIKYNLVVLRVGKVHSQIQDSTVRDGQVLWTRQLLQRGEVQRCTERALQLPHYSPHLEAVGG